MIQMSAGYSQTPLANKLGLKKALNVLIINSPMSYGDLIGDITEQIGYKNSDAVNLDFIHFFTNSVAELERELPTFKLKIKKDGMIWVSWYKKSSGKSTELSDYTVRNIALSIGLVDIKVCAVNEDWSALKLVYRIKER